MFRQRLENVVISKDNTNLHVVYLLDNTFSMLHIGRIENIFSHNV